jgi:cob(I)alamin adenosyltransferase
MNDHPSTPALVMLFTGKGKGKTTAALGMLMRARGHGRRCAVIQFIKSRCDTGEYRFIRQQMPEVTFIVSGAGFVNGGHSSVEEHRKIAAHGWSAARKLMTGGELDLLILDEFTYALRYGFLDEDDVISALQNRSPGVDVVITGRDASPRLHEIADLISDIGEVRHPWATRGVRAKEGIDY